VRGAPAQTRDSVVVALYERGLRGYDRRTAEGITDAITAFTAAVQRDSTFAAAWAGLARAYVRAYERRFAFPGGVKDSVLRLAVAAGDRALAAEGNSSDVRRSRSIRPTRRHGTHSQSASPRWVTSTGP
jgi:hypothetical protein